jgi:hypothetical protein
MDIDIKLPITGNGWIQVKVAVPDIEALSGFDRQFFLSVLEKIAAFAPIALNDPVHPSHPVTVRQVDVPEVLRGVVGGRP